ncbi:MAG TPA: ABC transporter permease [Telluria sp.]
MFRHLLLLIWKRKSRNLMLSLEILLAFVVVFAIVGFAVRSNELYHLPTGFAIDNVWSVRIGNLPQDGKNLTPEVYEHFKRSLAAVPGVEQVAFASTTPYLSRTWSSDFSDPLTKREALAQVIEMDDDALPLMHVRPMQGRLFERADNGAAAIPVVINQRMARALFGTVPALGKVVEHHVGRGTPNEPMRVVGIIEDYRSKGEFAAPVNMIITRSTPSNKDGGMQSLLIKVRPGTTRAFEETLSRQLKLINNTWSYEIAPLSVRRTDAMKSQVTPMIVLSVVATFLLLMVAFGLFGVLWQNTTIRIPELGLRRAVGASAASIYRQIIAEQILLSTGAMLIGILLLVQLPITGALGEHLNWSVFLSSAALSMAVIYLLSLLCSVYPGWRASRLSPTEALHYE